MPDEKPMKDVLDFPTTPTLQRHYCQSDKYCKRLYLWVTASCSWLCHSQRSRLWILTRGWKCSHPCRECGTPGPGLASLLPTARSPRQRQSRPAPTGTSQLQARAQKIQEALCPHIYIYILHYTLGSQSWCSVWDSFPWINRIKLIWF